MLMAAPVLASATSMNSLMVVLSVALAYTMTGLLGTYHPMVLNGFFIDKLSCSLIMLTILVMFLASISKEQTFNTKALSYVLVSMVLILLLAFSSNSHLQFYMMFELSLIPILLMITGWGYQPERIAATYFMILYTVTASLPLLLWMLVTSNLGASFSLLLISPALSSTFSSLESFVVLLAFLVKFPIFSMHLWLPKAHVEAPLIGSMILAAILLKLGGFGMWRCLASMPNSFTLNSVQAVSLMGGSIIAILCIRQTDMKVLIAYSSVAHMSMVISALSTQTSVGAWGALVLMVAHGVASSGMFSAADSIYQLTHTRSLLLTGSLLSVYPHLTVLVFLMCMGSMGAPPTLNLLSEIICINSIVPMGLMFALPLSLLTFFGAAYSLLFYASSQQGQLSSLSIPLPPALSNNTTSLILHAIWLMESTIIII